MSHGTGIGTIGLVLHPTRAVDRSVGTITDWSRGHRGVVLARQADAGRVPDGVEAVPDRDFVATARRWPWTWTAHRPPS